MKAGIREIRDNFSRIIARVRRGEEVVITDRGEEIAVIRPIRHADPTAEWLSGLVDKGLIEPSDTWGPIKPRARRLTGKLLSELVLEEREAGW